MENPHGITNEKGYIMENVKDTPIERLALGSAIIKKLKNNFVDTVGDLTEAIHTGQIRWMCSQKALKQIRTVLCTAGIEIPD